MTRYRRTNAQLDDLDEAILLACAVEHPVTVRGVFYRVMSAGAVSKDERGYGAVQRRTLALRRSGRLPYAYITDGTRTMYKPVTWDSVDQLLDDAASSYRRALWNDQDAYVEIWSEKDAITGVVRPVTAQWDVPLMIARGYSSESFLWSAAETIQWHDKPTYILQLGDHDPSGVDAWRHTQAKLREFCPTADLTFERLAVTEDQIEELGLPLRPTKRSDSRSMGFAGGSVEVDAIPPSVLRRIVLDAIEGLIDPHALAMTRLAEDSERDVLGRIAGRRIG